MEDLGALDGGDEKSGSLPPLLRRRLESTLRHRAEGIWQENLALGRGFKGVMTVAPRADTPAGVLADIVRAARAAGFVDVRFAVARSDLR